MRVDGNCVRLYSAQSRLVAEKLREEGVCFSKQRYIEKKYEESAGIFLTAYRFFAREATAYVPKPEGAELPYWVFPDPSNIEVHENDVLLALDVPLDQAVFFDMYDWGKLLSLRYFPEDAEDAERFEKTIKAQGVRNESDIMLTQFYPLLRREVESSWKRLFRYHEAIRSGSAPKGMHVQAALWCLRKEWLVEVL